MRFLTALKRTNGQINYIQLVLRLRLPLAVATMGLAVVGLGMNYLGVDLMLRPLGDGAATHPITALCLFAIGFCVYNLQRFGRTPVWRYILEGGVIIICAARLMEAGLTTATGAPAWGAFGPVAGFSGYFSIESAVALGAFATASLLRQGLGRGGMMLLVVGLVAVFNRWLELSYGTLFFNGHVGAVTLLALSSAALSLVSVYVNRPFVRVAFLKGNIGKQTRVMVVAAVGIPWACGFILHLSQDVNGVVVPLQAALISGMIWSMLVILLTTSAHNEGADVASRQAEQAIAKQSRIDPSSNTLNRFGMTEALERTWLDFRTNGTLFGMLILDLDYFHRINETFGHEGSEDVLQRIAATIHPHLRDTDALGRWSGDEFLILLKIKNKGDTKIVAGRLRDAFKEATSPFCTGLNVEPMAITAPFGMSEMLYADASPNDALVRANDWLHFVKENGSDHVVPQYDLLGPLDVNDKELAFLADEDLEPSKEIKTAAA